MDKQTDEVIQKALRHIQVFTRLSEIYLRRYQIRVAEAIVESVKNSQGLSFVVMFPRQSGKNEVQAQIEAYFLGLYMLRNVEIVKVSPTLVPQSQIAMRRLERVLRMNHLLKSRWFKEQGTIFRVGGARVFFLSGSPTANIVGATASTLLECDEAQDVLISKWDKEVNPMAASTNATRVFWGTAWTNRTLLARERRAAEAAQAADGIQRVFVMRAEDVAAEVPAYGQFVAGEVAKLGRNHPFVKTQYFSEEIDAEGGMFPPERLAIMQGDHELQPGPTEGRLYAFLVDIAGEDEGAADGEAGADALRNPGRDATTLTVVEVDLSGMIDPLIQAPAYKVVYRWAWVGVKHTALNAVLKGLGELWKPRYWVMDNTGVGAGLTSFIDRAFPGQVLPYLFNSSSKSKLGWGFLAVIESGRFKTYKPAKGAGVELAFGQRLHDEFLEQLGYCQHEIIPGPGRIMRWGVPDGTRAAGDGKALVSGELVHDDLIISAALCTELDGLEAGFDGSGT